MLYGYLLRNTVICQHPSGSSAPKLSTGATRGMTSGVIEDFQLSCMASKVSSIHYQQTPSLINTRS